MNWIRTITLCVVAACAAGAFADSEIPNMPDLAAGKKLLHKADANPLSFLVPKVGVRIGGGQWNNFMLVGGVDVTFNVPFIPLPALRLDGEIWSGSNGDDRHGNALSLEGIQTFALGYVGLGPSYFFTDNQGDHRSGFGAKLLGGLNFPGGLYLEVGTILGPPTPPVFFTIGERF